jgi:hypothetical protein
VQTNRLLTKVPVPIRSARHAEHHLPPRGPVLVGASCVREGKDGVHDRP